MDTPRTHPVDTEIGEGFTKHVKERNNLAFKADEQEVTNTGKLNDSRLDVVESCTNDRAANECKQELHSMSCVESDRSKERAFAPNEDIIDVKNHSRCSRFRDPLYRKNILKSSFILWGNIAMGWLYGQMGPTLPDLRLITDASLEQVTWLFTGFSIGYLIGCLISGIFGERITHEGVIALCSVTCALAVALLPWIPNVIGMAVIRVIIGFCIGGNDTGTHSLVFKIWGSEGGPCLQMIHAMFSVGGVLSPLVSKPFMIQVNDDGDLNSTYCSNVTSRSILNTTEQYIARINSTEPTVTCITHTDTNVQYAYLITSIIMFSAAMPFMVLFIQACRNAVKIDNPKDTSIEESGSKVNYKFKTVLICIPMVISYLVSALTDLFPILLTTFMMSKMKWTQQASSTLTAMFFAGYGMGNGINIFTLLVISSTKMIIASYTLGIIALSCFVYGVVTDQSTFLWVTVPAIGMTFSSILPTLFTWTQSHVTPITTRISSGLLVAGSIGIMVNPILMGYLMDNLSPMWFVYISCGEAVLCFLLFCLVLSLSKRCKTNEQMEEGTTIYLTRL